jgi:hypothetical protein
LIYIAQLYTTATTALSLSRWEYHDFIITADTLGGCRRIRSE